MFAVFLTIQKERGEEDRDGFSEEQQIVKSVCVSVGKKQWRENSSCPLAPHTGKPHDS